MRHIHLFKCKTCGRKYEMEHEGNTPFNPTKKCYELGDKKSGCTGNIRWDSWDKNSKPRPVLTDTQPIHTIGIGRLKITRSTDKTTNMIATLHIRLNDTTEWFDGKCGSQKQSNRENIPQEVWDSIPEDWDVEDMRFGRNCAEVQALKKLYKTHGTSFQSLRACRFIAMDKSGNVRGPCKGCSTWMKKYGIQAYFNGAWQVPR